MSELTKMPVAGLPRAPCEQPGSNGDSPLRLLMLQHDYVLDEVRSISKLLEEEPVLFELLSEAVRPLRKAFGEGRLMEIRTQDAEDGSFLNVAVQLPADFGDGRAEQALSSFDRDWWLDNCHRSGGSLVFDYEFRDHEFQNAI